MTADFPILLDACVLANYSICDLFLRLAETPRLYVPRWSEEILQEVKRTQRDELKPPWPATLIEHWQVEVRKAFPDSILKDYEPFLPSLTNHEKDRHVLAAAIKGSVSVIVTFNLKHFPSAALKPWNIEARHPQDYLLTLYSINPGVVMAKVAGMAGDKERDLEDQLIHLGKSVPDFASQILADMGRNPGTVESE